MSLSHILLGMLSEPASGYDLKKSFERTISHFWSAGLSQIYPTLAVLEKQRHVESTIAPSDKGPHRKIYARTESGFAELVRWLETDVELKQERVHFLGRVFFLDAVSPDSRLKFMGELRDAFAARLDALLAVEEEWRSRDPGYPDHLADQGFYRHLTLRLGLMKQRTLVEWADECLAEIRARTERRL